MTESPPGGISPVLRRVLQERYGGLKHRTALDTLMRGVSNGGRININGPLVVLALLQLARRSRSDALFVLTAALGAQLIDVALKGGIDRARPRAGQREGDALESFPSDHALYVTSLVSAFSLLAWPTPLRWAVLLPGSVFAALVGVSRCYLRRHHPTDVLAGWGIGAGWTLLLRRNWPRTAGGAARGERR